MTREMTITFGEKKYSLDRHGFLFPPRQWDESFAEGMAEVLGIYGGLTERHWEVIRYLRHKFVEENDVPVIVIACAEMGLRLWELRDLFPTGYHRGACKIAGISYQFMHTTNHWLTYETSAVLKAEYRTTSLGFLEDFDRWNERFAQLVIRQWKLRQGLTDSHRRMIAFLRDYYQRTRNIPTIFEACRATALSLEAFRELFPEGYRRGACRMAGLPFVG